MQSCKKEYGFMVMLYRHWDNGWGWNSSQSDVQNDVQNEAMDWNDTVNEIENDTVNDTEELPLEANKSLNQYKRKKRATAEKLMRAIADDENIAISEMSRKSSISESTVKRYSKELQKFGIL